MKVLLLTTEEKSSSYSEFYTGLHKQLGSMDMRRLLPEDQVNLKQYFAHAVDLTKFDRIIFHFDFDVLKPQVRFLQHLDNIVFYDTDAHSGKERSKSGITLQVKFFKKLPWSKIIVSNYRSMKKFQDAGLDAWCVPEGFNSNKYQNSDDDREIELAFIENINVPNPTETKQFKEKLIATYPNTYIEPNIVEAGQSKLNKVRFAICADIGRREYSGKLFQAMASGCLVLSYDQGAEESFYLSFKDMENIVLFTDFDVLIERLSHLQAHPEKAQEIAQAGYELALEHHQEASLGRQAGNYIAAGMRERDDYGLGISAFGFRF